MEKYQAEPHKKTSGTLPGVFSISSDEVKGSDLKEIKQIFQRGQQKAQSFIKMLFLMIIRILKK